MFHVTAHFPDGRILETSVSTYSKALRRANRLLRNASHVEIDSESMEEPEVHHAGGGDEENLPPELLEPSWNYSAAYDFTLDSPAYRDFMADAA